MQQLSNRLIQTGDRRLREFYQDVIQDAYKRLLQPSISNRVIGEKRDWADEASIETFEANLRALLLAAPAGRKATLGIDPGFRTGCKVAVISDLGKFLTYETIFFPISRLNAVKKRRKRYKIWSIPMALN